MANKIILVKIALFPAIFDDFPEFPVYEFFGNVHPCTLIRPYTAIRELEVFKYFWQTDTPYSGNDSHLL